MNALSASPSPSKRLASGPIGTPGLASPDPGAVVGGLAYGCLMEQAS